MVSAYVNHCVNLARGVLAMHRAGLDFESISLVRSTMESAVTAAGHVLYPEKTPHFLRNSANERRSVLKQIIKQGLSEAGPAMEQVDKVLAEGNGQIDPEG